jgi:iron complex outermembrane receptor protein
MFLSIVALGQENGSIQGTLRTSDGNPAEYVNIKIEGTSRGTIADRDGNFEIKNLRPGIYNLVASFIGLETKNQSAEIKSGEITKIEFVLTENAQRLEEIVISSGRQNESPFVSKMPLKNLENPQAYSSVSLDILKQQAVTNFDDALKNVPGIHRLWESTGRYGDGASYFALRGFEAQATMVNGLPGLTSGSLDPANIEKIEVIKGPSGTLFGSSFVSYGGLVNTVTKKPYSGFGGEVSYTAGSFGLNRVAADINAPLKGDQVILRVNTAFHTENSFQDAGFRNSFFISPTLSFKVNERLSFLLLTEFMQEEKTNPAMLFLGRDTPLQFKNLDEINYDPTLSLTSNDLSVKNPRYNLQGQMNYKISNQWASQTVISRGRTAADGYYSYLYDNENGLGEFSLWMSNQQGMIITTDIQQNFIGDFEIAGMRNRVVVGLDYFSRNNIDNSSGYAWVHNVNPQGDVSYDYPYTEEVETEEHYLTRSSIDNLIAITGLSKSHVRDAAYSAYFSDVINITPQVMVMASLRVDYFDTEGDITTSRDNYTQTALSPKFGLIYQVVADKVSLFANYMNGFKNVAPQKVQLPDDGDPDTNEQLLFTFEPEYANQMEFGVKTSLFNDKLNATISYYDIEVSNVVIGNLGDITQGGEVESKGVDFELTASPVDGLNILAGFSYNDSEIIDGDDANVWLETGRRPIYAGPSELFNFWATYTLKSGALQGFGVGLGGNYASELNILDSQVTGVFTLPSYTVLNSTLFYNTPSFRVALNVNNVSDKQYYTGYSTINPQKPRNVVLSLAYKF